MSCKRMVRFASVISMALAVGASPMRAQSDALEALSVQSLHGLSGILSVEVAESGGLEEHLSVTQLQRAVELEIRRAGIRIGADLNTSAGLACELTSLPISEIGSDRLNRYAVSYECYVLQTVKIPHSEATSVARTWSQSGVAIWGVQRIESAARETLINLAAQFANVFLAANPPI